MKQTGDILVQIRNKLKEVHQEGEIGQRIDRITEEGKRTIEVMIEYYK